MCFGTDFCFSYHGGGQEEQAAKIDPKADQVMQQLSDYAKELKSFRAKAVNTVRVEAQGMKSEMITSYRIGMQQPNRLALVVERGMMGTTIICDGKNVYTHIPVMNRYAVSEAPEQLEGLPSDEAMFMSGGFGMGFDTTSMTDALLQPDPYGYLMDGVNEAEYLGTEEVDGVRCHHLKFSQDELDWEMWVEAGDRPLPRKVVPDMSKAFAQMEDQVAGFEGMKMETSLEFADWEVGIELPEDEFVFVPPAGAEKVDSLFEADFQDEPHPLLGEMAPSFQLDLLEGGQLALDKHAGQDVVILDFWATWCGPCIRALPILTEVAEDYKTKGVAFYAVNVMEDSATIREFLKQQELTMTVALDPEGTVSDLYGVEGIPQTVIIGKDGSVQVVHVGFLPDLKEKLIEELDALLEGTDLASEALSGSTETE